MSLIKCPYDNKTKQYIIPTKSWIEPLKLFISDDITPFSLKNGTLNSKKNIISI